MRGPSPLVYREEERHHALGRDATFSWSRALTHPPRCNRTRHRGRHLVSDLLGRHLGSHAVGPPSWIGSRGGRHLGSDFVTSLTLKWGLYYFYVQELPKAQPAVVLVLKRLRRRGNGLKSHPTDWEKPGIEPARHRFIPYTTAASLFNV